MLKMFVVAGAQQPPPEEAAATSGGPREILKARPRYKNVINTDLVDDPMLTAHNIKSFKRTCKELCDFAMVRPEYLSTCMLCRIVLTQSPLFVQNVITHSQKKSEKLKAVVSGHQQLAALDKRVSEEITKNGLLERKLEMLEHERTRETWLLKDDLRNLKKANFELQKQLEEQKKALEEQKNAHQEQLKE
jgi:hypothetical protein